MQTHHSASSVQVLSPVENHTGITSSQANAIADHYRQLGGFTIELSEHQFRSNIRVTPLPSAVTTYQAVKL